MADKKTEAEGNKTYVTDNDLRSFLKDNSPLDNTLIDDLEFSAEDIRQAFTYACDRWNDQPPYIGTYDYVDFPWRSKLIIGAAAYLLQAAAHRFRRNALQYSAGGLTVADQEKYQQYDAAAERLSQEFIEWVVMNKRALNAESGFAVIG